jgi:hypothetical protein
MFALPESLFFFQPLWRDQENVAHSVLAQLISDMQKLFDAPPNADESHRSHKRVQRPVSERIRRFAFSFVALVRSVGPGLLSPVANQDAIALLSRFLMFLRMTCEATLDRSWALDASRMMIELARVLDSKFSQIPAFAADLLLCCLSHQVLSETSFLRHMLQMQAEVLYRVNAPPTSDIIQRYLGEDVLGIRKHPESATTASLRNLFVSLIVGPNGLAWSEALEIVLSRFTQEIITGLSSMRAHKGTESRAIVLFNFSVLARIGTTEIRSSEEAFTRSFELICMHLPAEHLMDDGVWAACFGAVSALGLGSTKCPLLDVVFQNLLASTLRSALPHRTMLGLDFLRKYSLSPSRRAFRIPENVFRVLISVIIHKETSMRLAAAKCIDSFFQPVSLPLSPAQVSLLVRCCLARTNDTCEIVRQTYRQLAARLSFYCSWPQHWRLWDSSAVSVKSLLASWSPSRDVSYQWGKKGELQHFFSAILSSADPIDLPWLLTQHAVARATNAELSSYLGAHAPVEAGADSLIFFACSHAAQYCITNRLRSHLGGPAQTLEAIESMVVQLLADPSRGNSRTHPQAHSAAAAMLIFVAQLERDITAAGDGSLLIKISGLSAATSSFFRANKKVCSDWFSRMRSKLSQLAYCIGHMSDAVRHGTERLSYLSRVVAAAVTTASVDSHTLRKEIYQCTLCVANALLELNDVDGLDGLLRWCRGAFRPFRSASESWKLDFRWLSSMLLQAKGRYERAADSFASFLRDCRDDQAALSDSGVIALSIECLLSCFISVSDWEAFAAWTSDLDSEGSTLPISYSTAYLRGLIDFDHGDFVAVREGLSSFDRTERLTEHRALREAGLRLLDCMATLAATPGDLESRAAVRLRAADILDSLSSFPICAEEPSSLRASLHQLELTSLISRLSSSNQIPEIDSLFRWVPKLDSNSIELQSWNNLLRLMRIPNALGTLHFSVENGFEVIMKLARKTSNFRYAERLAEEAQLRSAVSPSTLFERAKLLHALNKPAAAMIQLWSILRVPPDSVSAPTGTGESIPVLARLKLARWLQLSEKQSAVIDQISGAISSLRSGRAPQRMQVDAFIGSTLREATEIGSGSARAWFQYADWLYRSGHHASKLFSSVKSDYDTMVCLLTPAEKSRVDLLIGRCGHLKTEDSRKDVFMAIVSKVLPRATSETPHEEVVGYGSPDETTVKLFSEIIGSEDVGLSREFMSIFSDVRRRILAQFRLAVDSYLKFLVVNPNDSGRQPNITATLRILRLLVKFGSDLCLYDSASRGASALATRLAAAPVAPWRGILPQLFARLMHHDEFVRSQVLQLVRRLGEIDAQAVIYALIATAEPHSLASVRQSISNHSAVLLTKLEWFVTELRRVTFLPEEVALASLRNILNDVHSRLRTIRSELSRSESGADPSRVKYSLADSYATIMRPAVSRLERFLRDMSRYGLVEGVPPAAIPTKHDLWFVNRHKEAIEAALRALRDPPADVEDLDFVAVPLREVIKELNKLSKRSTIRLDSVSAELSRSGVDVPVPGVPQSGSIVASVDPHIQVLPTKTKPKKLTMTATDGKKYSFLLKGKEDLHLDERIMQLLTTVNQFLQKDTPSETRGLCTRHYAVIPLGRTGGLIQWVDRAVPLFHVYSEFHRHRPRNMSGTDGFDAEPTTSLSEPRKPIDQFYAKLMPALKAAGIAETDLLLQVRPKDVLKRVFLELEKETPRELLERELWLSCADAAEWWQKTASFNRSAAVMSMVGYVIGLGDRHLDNILFDFTSGELIHIDYNVCFEKGLKLRIPEVVPFRLTSIMQRALGIAGVDGPFRSASEITMGVLRRNREPLLTLLEAFVYDPVVDWTTSEKIQAEERSMELDIAFTLLLSRTGSITEPSVSVKNLWDSLFDLEQSLLISFSSMESFFDALQTAASEIETKSAASIQRSTLVAEISKLRSAIQESTDAADRLREEDLECDSSCLRLLNEISAFSEDASSSQLALESTFASLASTSTKAPLSPIAPQISLQNLPRTLSQRPILAALKLSDSFISRCIEKDEQMFELNRNRESLLRQILELLERYRKLISETASISSYLQSTPSYMWLSFARNLPEFDLPGAAQVVRQLGDTPDHSASLNSVASLRLLRQAISEASSLLIDLNAAVSETRNAVESAESRVLASKNAIEAYVADDCAFYFSFGFNKLVQTNGQIQPL